MKLLPFVQGLLTSLCLFSFTGLFAADVSFRTAADTVQRNGKESVIRSYIIDAKGITDPAGTTVKVSVDVAKTTVVASSYTIHADFNAIASGAADKELLVHVHFDADPNPNRDHVLVLNIFLEAGGVDVSGTNAGTAKQLTITVKCVEAPLGGYNYLAYIGTNFDLVDGVKAKNLFFATNVFLPSRKALFGSGALLSLYGNRTVSSIDSSSNVRRIARILPLSDSTARFFYNDVDRVTTFYSDNLGAYFSPLVNLGGALSDEDNDLRLMFAPSAEVVWRRISNNTTFKNPVLVDSLDRAGRFTFPVEFEDSFERVTNQWEFKYGLGFLLTHETDDLSMRVYFAYGLSTVYDQTNTNDDPAVKQVFDEKPATFFSARAWITERTSGLTLQAEFTNIVSDPRPYYGVTLSKAIDFKNLGTVFQPLASR